MYAIIFYNVLFLGIVSVICMLERKLSPLQTVQQLSPNSVKEKGSAPTSEEARRIGRREVGTPLYRIKL